ETIYLESETSEWKEVLLDVLECMQVEPSFHLALKNSSAGFSPSLLCMVQACEENGRLDHGLEDVANALEENVVNAFFDLNAMQDLQEKSLQLEELLSDALHKKASDIHIVPQNKDYKIMFRTLGSLVLYKKVSKEEAHDLINSIKKLSCLHVDITNLPQDGRIKIDVNERHIDFRIATLPTILGEKLTMRVFDGMSIVLKPEQIFTHQKDLERFEELLKIPFGMILFCGPTGSGKTTTAYTALHSLVERGGLSIASIEDPVEYTIEGISQMQVQPKIDLTHVSALKSILRNDPDVIYVNEIMEEDCFAVMNRVALTGHLVLSTMHTDDCFSTIEKLLEIGVESFDIASALSTLVSQRLVRRICSNCKVEENLTANLRKQFNLDGNVKVFRGQGCEQCNHTGYKGRVAVYEFLKITKDLKDWIREKELSKLQTYLDGPEHQSLMDQAIELVKLETTSLEEVSRLFL
ncbi:Flp pilus assembly complex ATPase component TadA, partial [bacterium]|nr:Flp pilus assembly complex ATPase component TadA [bacterium]